VRLEHNVVHAKEDVVTGEGEQEKYLDIFVLLWMGVLPCWWKRRVSESAERLSGLCHGQAAPFFLCILSLLSFPWEGTVT
jgi:hypothetical protein